MRYRLCFFFNGLLATLRGISIPDSSLGWTETFGKHSETSLTLPKLSQKRRGDGSEQKLNQSYGGAQNESENLNGAQLFCGNVRNHLIKFLDVLLFNGFLDAMRKT